LNSLAIEEEANAARILATAIAERVHQLLQRSRLLDFEKHFVVVVRDLDVEVLGLLGLLFVLVALIGFFGHVARVSDECSFWESGGRGARWICKKMALNYVLSGFVRIEVCVGFLNEWLSHDRVL